jgi:hypothetical protein
VFGDVVMGQLAFPAQSNKPAEIKQKQTKYVQKQQVKEQCGLWSHFQTESNAPISLSK